MVKVIEIKALENNQGEAYVGLIVQSGIVPVKSKETGRVYLTAKTAFVPTTFDEETATALIGEQFQGSVRKVATDPYDYTIEDTGEVITMHHRWEYFDETLDIVEKQVVEKLGVY
jgi:hypothetical protein